MTCVICGQPIEHGRRHGEPPKLAKYCLKCRAERRQCGKAKYAWRPEFDEHLRANYYGGVNRRFRVLNRIVRLTGLPRWYIKRQAARLGLTMRIDRKPWTSAEVDLLERLVGTVSTASIARRLGRPENSVVTKLKRMGTSRRVRNGADRFSTTNRGSVVEPYHLISSAYCDHQRLRGNYTSLRQRLSHRRVRVGSIRLHHAEHLPQANRDDQLVVLVSEEGRLALLVVPAVVKYLC